MPGRCLASAAVALCVAVAATPSTLSAQDTIHASGPRVGRIVGVFDIEDGQPLAGADVEDRIGGGTARTQRAGLVGMAAFSSQHDSAVITVRKIGYADTTVLVMVGARDTVPYQIFLRHATRIDGLVVTAKETTHLPFYLRDFEDRMDAAKYSGAKAFTPSEFRKKDGLRLIDVLKDKAVGDKTQRCAKYLIYRDGVPWDPPEVEAFTAGVPREDADQFEAAMFYTLAQLPLDIAHTSIPTPGKRGGLTAGSEVCGVLLLYSRHR